MTSQKDKESKSMQIVNDSRMVAPALDKYAQGPLAELWKRPGLTARDRSMITLAALIARNQTIEMAQYMNLALDKRCEATRDFRDHHASRVLLRLGERDVGGSGCKEYLRHA